jgi:hypothetical protein
MSILCICINLNDVPEEAFLNVVMAIRQLGPCFRATETTYLVETDLLPNDVLDRLGFITATPKAKFLVFTVATGQEWSLGGGIEDEEAAVWMQDHVKQH